MPPKLLNKLIAPQLPAAALGLNSDTASAVLLDRRRRRGGDGIEFELRRAAAITLPEGLISPSFDEQNISNADELADALAELVTSAGLARQHRWSVALPEAATRSAILTLESDQQQTSRAETEELLRWKSERAFGAPLDDLRVRRERLSPDARGRVRYLAAGVRLSVLAEYEGVFARLGWRAGLILPRHVGEARWLMPRGGRNTKNGGGDALLISSHAAGFTAVLLRGGQPLIVREVLCDGEDCADELYRLLLFYRDRALGTTADPAEEAGGATNLRRLLVVGKNSAGIGLSEARVSEVVNETLGANMHTLDAKTIGLALPQSELSFDEIAAPAGIATLAWQ